MQLASGLTVRRRARADSRGNLRRAEDPAVSLAPRNRPVARPRGGIRSERRVPGGSITLDGSIEATPHVGQNGNFLIDTGASTSSVDARIFGVTVGSSIRIEGSVTSGVNL
jgi:hypothetical protein